MNQRPTCPQCGGHNITTDAICTWNMDQQVWEHSELTDSFYCTTCDEELSWVEMVELSTPKTPVDNSAQSTHETLC